MISLPFAAKILNAAALAEELDRYRLLSRDRFEELAADFPGGGATGLAEFLVARGELTPFQAERALSGQAKALALGPYRLLEPHQVGAFGPIFRASKGKHQFAIRVLPLRSLWQAKQAKQLVRSLASLSAHSAIVPLVDADSANGFHYLVWPLVEGELLADRVGPNSPLPPDSVASLLAYLAAALMECHARQLVHGLLTPQSISLNAKHLPRLLEFGAGMLLARNLAVEESLFDTMSSSLAVSGAFDYAAPEWVADPANPRPAADQYSLGAIGYFALTGSAPTAERDLSRFPEGLAAAITRLLEPNPDSRFSGMDEAREVLAELAELAEVPASSVSFEPETHSRHGRSETSHSSCRAGLPSAASLRPTDRDGTEASVHFDLPDVPVEEPVVVANRTVSGEAQETLRPTPWAATTPNLPVSTPPPESRLLSPSTRRFDFAPLPELPAAPLPPLPDESPSSGKWNATTAPRQSEAPNVEQPSASHLWKKVKRKVLFWQTPGDTVQVSVFGPAQVAHTQAPRLTVFVHSPSVAESVRTLARAFHHDAILLGSGPLAMELSRGSRLDVHVSIAHISVSNPLAGFNWRGQPHRLMFDLIVPWEAPVGPALGVVSIGHDDIRVGKVEFELPILDGTG